MVACKKANEARLERRPKESCFTRAGDLKESHPVLFHQGRGLERKPLCSVQQKAHRKNYISTEIFLNQSLTLFHLIKQKETHTHTLSIETYTDFFVFYLYICIHSNINILL